MSLSRLLLASGSTSEVKRLIFKDTALPSDLTSATPFLREVSSLFQRRGVKAYLVGGFLRDALLHHPTRDVDLAVSGDALALARDIAVELKGHFVALDAENRVARVALTSLNEPWHLDVACLAGDLCQDLGRRDFTVNAMALDLAESGPGWEGRLVDPFHGRSDLSQGVIRSLGEGVFREDPIRLLRAIRLKAKLGFTLHENTLMQIKRDKALIAGVAGERIRDELLWTLEAPGLRDSLHLMDEAGLLEEVIPELSQSQGVTQPKEHYWDVYNHLLEAAVAVEQVLPSPGALPTAPFVPWDSELEAHFREEASDGHSRATLLKLAALIHDIGKPATRSVEETGRIRFLGHHEVGAEMAEAIAHRLRLSRRGIEMIRAMVRHHLRPTQIVPEQGMPTRRALFRYYRDLEDVAIDTLYLNLADYLAARGGHLTPQEWERHAGLITYILREGAGQGGPQKMVGLVDGQDLMEAFGLPSGPVIGRLLRLVREAEAVGEVASREEVLSLARHWLDKEALSQARS